MIRKYVLPFVALAGALLAAWTAIMGSRPVPAAQPVAEPVHSPYPARLSGAGLVEASSENIRASTPVPGLVVEVHVRAGAKVNARDPLFRLDDRDVQAEIGVRKALLEAARQRLAQLKSFPRPEDLPPLEAKVAEAEAAEQDAQVQLKRVEGMTDKRAMSEEDLSRRRYALLAAGARASQARAELTKARAGAWKPDLAVSEADVATAEAQLEASNVTLERLTVRSPVEAEILKVDIRAGEYAMTGQSLVVLGSTDTLHVRVDIDENEAWRYKPGARAIGYVRGNRDLKVDMTFVRIEPYVIPKMSLTGSSSERVDTRVMQLIYKFDRKALAVYVGQQMDVDVELGGNP